MKPGLPTTEIHPKPPSIWVFLFDWMWGPAIRRWWPLLLSAAILFIVAVVWGYPKLREERVLRSARTAFAAKDYVTAAHSARIVLRSNPNRVEAVRLMVDLSRLFPDSPDRKKWCVRLLELEPGDRELLVETTRLFLAGNEPGEARKLMEQYAPQHPGDVGILLWRGILSFLNKDPANARLFLNQAAALDPANAEVQLNLNKLWLMSNDPAEVRRAVETLEKWPSDRAFRAEAVAALFYFHRDRGEGAAALQVGRRILADSAFPLDRRIAVFRDLGGMKVIPHNVLWTASEALRKDCEDSPQKAALLMASMLDVQAWDDVLAFRGSLPPPVRMNPLVSVPAVTALLKLGKMDQVRELAAQPAWEGGEEIRRLIQLRVLELDGGKPAYASLADEASAEPKKLVKLASLCRQWSWDTAEEVFLLKMAHVLPASDHPLKELNRLYHSRGDALGMLRVAREACQKDPSNFGAANQVAVLCLLLGLDGRTAFGLAQQNYQRQPDHPIYTATYAFALSRNGKAAEGLALLEKLPGKFLALPEVSLYHIALLQAGGQGARAQELARKLDKTNLLPEEKRLLP